MTDVKISQLPSAATPLTGSEIFPLVQNGVTVNSTLNTISSAVIANDANFIANGTGAVYRTVQSKLRDFVAAADFGVVADGVTDDTVALTNAMVYCRSNAKTLVLNGNIKFVASSVPLADKFAGTGGFYVYGCSMVGFNSATLNIDGAIGFDFSNLKDTRLEGFRVVTTNFYSGENQLETAVPYLFSSSSGTKNTAVYRDLDIYRTVPDLTGQYRGGTCIYEFGCASLIYDNIKISNATIGLRVDNSEGVTIRNIYTYNIQTSVYLVSVNYYQVVGLSHINTQQQADYWVGRLATPVRNINGMSAILSESCTQGSVSGFDVYYAIERGAYIQSKYVEISNSKVRNSSGFKVVGTSQTFLATDVYVENCHVMLDATYPSTRGRVNLSLSEFYWADNIHVTNCSATNDLSTSTVLTSLCDFSGVTTTIDNVFIKDCYAHNAQRLVYVILKSYTAAQLAAINPGASFLNVNYMLIEDCFIKKCDFRNLGSLITERDAEASADAKNTYSIKDVQLINNTIELPSTVAVRDDFIFDVRYADTVTSKGTKINLPFVNNGFFGGAITAPYQNITLIETDLKWSGTSAGLITALSRLNCLKNSKIGFTFTASAQFVYAESVLYADGAFSGGTRTVTVDGKGYYQFGGAVNCGIEMNASGNYYLGKAVGGVKTDQLSTPAAMGVGITVTAPNLELRGDAVPTIEYHAKLTLI